MPDPPSASPLADVEASIAASRPDAAVEASFRALRAGAVPLEILRAAARAAATRYDPASGLAPHGLATLAAVANLRATMDPRHVPQAMLQSIVLAASEKKLDHPQPPPSVVAGEVTHLVRSALFAARAGNAAEAESLFLGVLTEGRERRMVGDTLFRAALEDLGDGGHKLLMSVMAWHLARALGFREARTILRPAVQYLVAGERNRKPYEAMMAVLGKEWVDLATLASGGRTLDETGRSKLVTPLAAPTEEACLASTLALLRDGYAATAVAEGIATEAAKRVLAAEGYHLELIHALLYARAACFVLTFSRTSERLYALFLAALRVRSPAPHLPSVVVPEPVNEEEGLARLSDDLTARRSREAAARVRTYLAHGYSAKRLLATLAYHASLDSSLANQGHNLLLADACAVEYEATRSPEFLMVLAKSVAASPKDLTASKAWTQVLGL